MIQNLPEHWQRFDDTDAMAKALVKRLLSLAETAIQTRGRFTLVTAGGHTPQKCYRLLAKASADWANWHIYMGDERCLPQQDPERNSVQLYQAWLFFGQIPEANIHLMPAELGPELAAESYRAIVAEVERFDVVLLGMGEDGHTASLFPGHSYPPGEAVVTEYHSPKPPPERISLSYERLSQSRYVFKLISGAGKRDAVKQLWDGINLPIQQVQGEQTQVLIDQSAWPFDG